MSCPVCGAALPPYQGIGRPRTMCSSRCRNWRTLHGDATPRWLTERRCPQCDSTVTDPDIRVRYCSTRCSKLHQKGSLAGKERACRYCDAAFRPTDNRQVYCSTACRIGYNRRFGTSSALRKQARKRGAALGLGFTMLDIARRDGWICALCITPIDPNLRGDRFLEATVDHVVPIVAGGRHDLANAQLAHWTCNAAKRDSIDVITMSVPGDGKRVIVRWRDVDQRRSLPSAEQVTAKIR
jgi:hypothetical protein